MIDTVMALWNRGRGGRLVAALLIFISISIGISLLFVTVGSVWGSFSRRVQPGFPLAGSTSSTTTGVAQATVTPDSTPVLVVTPCIGTSTPGGVSPVVTVGLTRTASTGNGVQPTDGKNNKTPTPAPTRPASRPTVTPVVTVTIAPSPSPTLPAITPTTSPTVGVTPTAAITPTGVSTPTPTPTDTSTPGLTPTVTIPPNVTPTDTSPPGMTPTSVPTQALNPTATAGSPTTTATAGAQVNGGGPIVPGTLSSSSTNQNQANGIPSNCLGDTVSSNFNAFAALSPYLWWVFGASIPVTALLCSVLARRTRRSN